MMVHSKPRRKRRNSSKVNLAIAFTFHASIGLLVLFLAAHEGLLGRKLRTIAVEMIKETPPKPKEPEKPKEVEVPKAEPPKVEVAQAPKQASAPAVSHAAPPPTDIAPAAAAPPPADIPSFDFDGGKTVQTSSDPVVLYKGGLEYAFRAHWSRPTGRDDDNFVDEVEISVDSSGDIHDPALKKSAGDSAWDASVLAAIASVKTIGRPPPAGFPSRVTVRFDLQDTEAISQ